MMRRDAAIAAVLTVATIHQVAAQPAAPAPDRPASSEQRPDDDPQFRCKNAVGPITVTFKPETEVKDLIAWAMSFTCRNFVYDPRVVATGRKVSFIVPGKMTAAEAYQLFLGALSMTGLTVVPRGNVLRIVDAPTARREALPLIKKGSPDDTDQIVRYVYRPSYVGTDVLQRACLAMKSEAGDVAALGSLLLITEYASNLRQMLAFARLVDVPGGSDGIYTLPVRHADAAKLTEKLNAILNLSSQGAVPPRPAAPEPAKPEVGRPEVAAVPSKIVVDERTNTLIIASSEAGYQRVKVLVERLDVALETEDGGAIHVYPLGSAIADELAKTLNAALGDGRAAKPATGAPTSPAGPAAGRNAASAGPAAAALDSLGTAIDGQVRVIADPPTNALIVMSSGRDFLAIKDVIRQLDLPRRQVYIEVLILEVAAGNDSTIGAGAHGGIGETSGTMVLGGLTTGAVKTTKILDSLQETGLVAGVVGKSMTLFGLSIPSYALLFRAIAEQTHANIISSPSVIAVDNVEAKYKVGIKIPVNKGTVLTPFGGTTASQPSIELTEFPLKLDIKPHISNDDMVLLEIKHEADQLTNETERGPRSSTRSIETRVVVHDQETIMLGGLTQENESETVSKVPLLGDIPLLGYLFKTTIRSKHKTNLVVLLTPYIIKDRRDLQAIRERKTREHDEFAQSISTLDRMAYEPRVDYRKKRGLVEDINRAVQDAEHDAAARATLVSPERVKAGSVDTGDQQ